MRWCTLPRWKCAEPTRFVSPLVLRNSLGVAQPLTGIAARCQIRAAATKLLLASPVCTVDVDPLDATAGTLALDVPAISNHVGLAEIDVVFYAPSGSAVRTATAQIELVASVTEPL